MEADKLMDSVKNYFNDRLRNPYFASVLVIWIFINRVAVFGLFNFGAAMTLNQRVLWIQSKLSGFEILVFKGLIGSIIWAAVWGFLAMAFFNLLNSVAKAFFKIVNRVSIRILQKVDPESWVSIHEYQKLKTEMDEAETELNQYREKVLQFEERVEESRVRNANLNAKVEELIKTHSTETKKNKEKLSKLNSLIKNKDDEIDSLQNLIKEKDSVKMAKLRGTFNAPGDFFKGVWKNEHTYPNGQKGYEEFEVLENHRYVVKDEHVFDIVNFNIDGNTMRFDKVSVETQEKLHNVLEIVDREMAMGKEKNDITIRYSKVK